MTEAEEMGVIQRKWSDEDAPLTSVAIHLCCPIQLASLLVTEAMEAYAWHSAHFPDMVLQGVSLRISCPENGNKSAEHVQKAVTNFKAAWPGTCIANEKNESAVRLTAPETPELYFDVFCFTFNDDCAGVEIVASASGLTPIADATPLYRDGALVEDNARMHGAGCSWEITPNAGLYVKDSGRFPALLEPDTQACL